eukprot:11268923-Alexandrium_andersonii.AAC.1
MSASLVGSEMCIRDSLRRSDLHCRGAANFRGCRAAERAVVFPVGRAGTPDRENNLSLIHI